jgi:hypothetical protein
VSGQRARGAFAGWLASALLAMALLAPRPAAAADGDDACTYAITVLEVGLTQPGTYCMASDLATANPASSALYVQADNVTIDCNGHAIDGRGAGASTKSSGIYANAQRNLVVRHCRILGFYWGINVLGSAGGGHLVEDNRIEGTLYEGIRVVGDGSVVRRNRVYATGATTGNNTPYAITVQDSSDVIDNWIVGVSAPPGSGAGASGIYAYYGNTGSGVIAGNHIRGVVADGASTPNGIFVEGYASLAMRDNDIVGAGTGTGIVCQGGGARIRDNVLSGWATATQNCPSGGGNVVRP